MKLYKIKYDNYYNKIRVDEYEVEEKQKTFVTRNTRFKKENLDKVLYNYGFECITLNKEKINDIKVSVLNLYISKEMTKFSNARENIEKAKKLKKELPF